MPDFAYRAAQADGRIGEGRVGAASREKFVFEGKARGETEVVMLLKRPWETGALEERRFKVTVE